MMKLFKYIPLFSLLLFFTLSCQSGQKNEDLFSYRSIIDKEYRFNVGKVIPITISQSIETDGDLSKNGDFFFYTSNKEGGNYDLYLRSMNDITTVRLTSHPSKDISPAISPDGKTLAFVSYRTDPEGDIFTLKLKPKNIIKNSKESIKEIESLDKEAVNISLHKNKYGVVINRKDSSPVWSPDGKQIAFTSTTNNCANIWMMKPNGSESKRITSKGGDYPSFSEDGKKIIFISYRDNIKGDIYSVDLNSLKEVRLTNSDDIKLYPSYAGSLHKIIYSSIETDTNNNGHLDLQDHSVIKLINLKEKTTYAITRSSVSSFKAKWLPSIKTRDYNGVIVYTDITNKNINLNIIPEKGIIPLKNNAKLQYTLCNQYIEEYDDEEKYSMSLKSVYHNFGKQKDTSSIVYVNKALRDMALFFKKKGNHQKSSNMIQILVARAENGDTYAISILNLLKKNNFKIPILKIKNNKIKDVNEKYYTPFIMEDEGDILFNSKLLSKASVIYSNIIKNHPSFERIKEVKNKYALGSDSLLNKKLSNSAKFIITKGSKNQKISLTKNLISPFLYKKYNKLKRNKIYSNIRILKSKNSKNKKIMALLHFAEGALNDQSGDEKNTQIEFEEAIKLSHPNDLIYYLANIRLGEIERKNRNITKAEKYFQAGIKRYSRIFKTVNFKEKIIWLIDYYEKTGNLKEASGKYKEATLIYEKYINLITLIYNKKLYSEVYEKYAPRAHVLYINAYTKWEGIKGIKKLEEAYKEKLPIYRMDFNKAAIYGLAYIYTLKAENLYSSIYHESKFSGFNEIIKNLKKADKQIEWALFIDDTFIEPYLLKSWIYQFIDLERKTSKGENDAIIAKFFPIELWEKNIAILEKALNTNDENIFPENEGNINLNLGNNYFLLTNYTRALKHYQEAEKYKNTFNTDIERALFHFHIGYAYWQNNNTSKARIEIKKAHNIYKNISREKSKKYTNQFLIFYKYYALFSRYEKKYEEAIKWYEKILTFAEQNKIFVDKARFLQEIAYCYKEIGKLDTAITYINQADILLKDYPSDTKKYNLKIKLFGIGPFSIFNMGPDTAVIGNNRIFYPLDRENKKLLNISLLEDISLLKNNFDDAIKFQKKKLSLLEKNDTSLSFETQIRSINNLGFYYFQSGKFKDAEKYFKKAKDLSVNEENLQGIFTSIMNITNLYALMIENEIDKSRNWKEETTLLIKTIENYINNYAETKLKQAIDELKKQKKLKKKEVTTEELNNLKEKIEQSASRIYYSLDIALGIIKFHRAELFYKTKFLSQKDKIKSSMKRLEINSSIYSDYSDALSLFLKSYKIAEENENKYLMTKLLLNSATCYEKIGEKEKAYVSLLDAIEMANKFKYKWLQIEASYKAGNFIKKFGKDFEGSEYMVKAINLFKSAADLIEENPLFFKSRIQKIDTFYKDLTSLMISQNQLTNALSISERGANIHRMMLINNIFPKFRNNDERSTYCECLSIIEKQQSTRKKISLLLEQGAEPESDKLILLTQQQKELSESLKNKKQQLIKKNPILLSYVESTKIKIPQSPNIILKFFSSEDKIICWLIENKNVTTTFIPKNGEEIKKINKLINKNKTNETVFIIANSTALELMNNKEWQPEKQCTLITGLDRIDEYLNNSNKILPSVYSDIKGLNSVSKDLPVYITENTPNCNLRDYSVIIDKKDNHIDITPSMMFSTKGLSPSSIININSQIDSDYIIQLSEAALYGGTKNLIFVQTDDKISLKNILKELYSQENNLKESKVITVGYINKFKSELENSKQSEKEFTMYKDAMILSNYDKARLHLSRWNVQQPNKDKIEYLKNMWLIDILKGDFSQAKNRITLFSPDNPKEENTLKLMQVYLLLHTGDFARAETLTKTIKIDRKKYADIDYIEILLTFSKQGTKEALKQLNSLKRPPLTIIPKERYLIPLSQYIMAFDVDNGLKMMKQIEEDAFISPGEHLLMKIMMGKNPPEQIPSRNIKFLWTINGDTSKIKEITKRNIAGINGYDNLSIFPVIFLATKYEKNNEIDKISDFLSSINLEKIIELSDTSTAIFLLNYLSNQMQQNGNYAYNAKLHQIMEKIIIKASSPYLKKNFLYKKALTLSILKKYEEAFASASKAESITEKKDSQYISLQLLLMNLYIKSGRYDEAIIRGVNTRAAEDLKPHQYYMLTLQKSLIELNRLSRLKKASKEDASKFEKLFIKSVNILKGNIKILNYQGYSEITEQIFDEFINYKFKTGQHQDAHYFNELKKLALISAETGRDFISNSGTIDPIAIQQALPENSVYINVSKNKNNLFVWALNRGHRAAFMIEEGFTKSIAITTKLDMKGTSSNNYTTARQELNKILTRITDMMKNKQVVILCTDNYTEKIKFELTGRDDYLTENTSLFYLVSPLFLGNQSSPISREITLTGKNDTIISHLEEIATAESGIDYIYTDKPTKGAIHILGAVKYIPQKKSYILNNTPYESTVVQSNFIYTNSRELKNSGLNNFFSFNRKMKVRAAIINTSDIQDINNAVFIENLYKEYKKSDSLTKAFSFALKAVRDNKKFNNPAYWVGFRMYINNLDLNNL